ncbi:unnamed protein product [Bursaphelenchus xylophilus]|nr:unnamed protein product [Bursaphelenchus xylophilus]CAG9094835.1 unnamed protein product [Bursaphelenchus xylophilus]
MDFPSDLDSELMTDAELAAQLQRQFDDEEMLTSRLNSSFNFLSTSLHGDAGSSKATEQDEEMARKLQRKFYIDMKRQGYSDMDLASMLDTMGEDTQLEAALRESVGASAPTCIEKYLVTLYNNSKYGVNDCVGKPGLEEIMEFREVVLNSLCYMSQQRIIDPTDTAEYIATNFIFTAKNWNDLEAGYFILKPLVPNISPWVHLHVLSPTDSWIDRLYQTVFNVNSFENELLMITLIRFMNISKRFVFMKDQECSKFASWYLSIPPLERYIPEITSALAQLTASAVNRLFPYFEQLYEYIRLIELSTNEGKLIEENVQHILKACTSVINDQGAGCITTHLEMLLKRPLDAIESILTQTAEFDSVSPSESWRTMAKNPITWLHRINAIVYSLGPWTFQRAYNHAATRDEDTTVPWAPLFTEVAARICLLISECNDNSEIIEETLTSLCLMVYKVGKPGESLIASAVENLQEGYQRNNSLEFLGIIRAAVFKLTAHNEADVPLSGFVDRVLGHVYASTPSPFQTPSSLPYFKYTFSMVDKYCSYRIASLVAMNSFDSTCELALECLDNPEAGLFSDAHVFFMAVLAYLSPHLYLREQKTISKIIEMLDKYGQRLGMICCKNALTESSLETTTSATAMLESMKRFNEQRVAQWVSEYLAENHHHVTPEQRTRFVEEFVNCSNHEGLFELATNFAKNFGL